MPTTRTALRRPPDLTAFALAHRALRRDTARLAAAVTGLDGHDTARARALRRWYGGYRTELARHHAVEDRMWFPMLAERVATFGLYAERIDRDHHRIEDAVAAVGATLDGLVRYGPGPSERARARDATCELTDLVDRHLEFEDSDVLPLYLRHVTQTEYAEVERRAQATIGLRRAPFALPWLLDAATPAERTRTLASAPLAHKVLWRAGRRRHSWLSARALGQTGTEVA